MKAIRHRAFLVLLTAAVLTLPACQEGAEDVEMETDTTAAGMEQDTLEMAYAQLQPTEGNDVRGTVSFTEAPEGVRVVASVMGLEEGEHGFHIHETGDCSAPDASSAGGHYAPDDSPHGAPTDAQDQRHLGDLGNITAEANGQASYERVDEYLTLSGPNSIIGKAVIVHENPDDLETQPTGNAGPRLACGVIERGSSEAGGMPGDTTTEMP